MKKVIIDGVNVSKCKHIGRDNLCYSEETTSFECKNNNCMFKQLEKQKYKLLKYRETLECVRDIADVIYNANCNYVMEAKRIIEKINKIIGVENE